MKRPNTSSGHVLIVVMVLLMLSTLLLLSGLERMKQDSLSTREFQKCNLNL
jgi:Tfp pilus assembly protein PilX